jgi:hypothetical protein
MPAAFASPPVIASDGCVPSRRQATADGSLEPGALVGRSIRVAAGSWISTSGQPASARSDDAVSVRRASLREYGPEERP